MQAGRLFQKRKGVTFSEDSTVGKIWSLPHFSIGKQCQSELLTKGHFFFLSSYPRPHFPNRITLHAETKDKTFWTASPCTQEQRQNFLNRTTLQARTKNKKNFLNHIILHAKWKPELSESHHLVCKTKDKTLWLTPPCVQRWRPNMLKGTTLQAKTSQRDWLCLKILAKVNGISAGPATEHNWGIAPSPAIVQRASLIPAPPVAPLIHTTQSVSTE